MFARSSAVTHGPLCSRRSALAIVSITGANLLSACSGLGTDETTGPPDGAGPTKGPAPLVDADVPDAEVLLATLASTREVLAACTAVAAPSSRRLRRICAVLEKQHGVLARLIDAGGLDTDDGVATTAGTDAASEAEASTTAGPPQEANPAAERRIATLLAEQSTGPGVIDALVSVSPTNLAVLMALHGQRAAAAQTLGAPVTWPVVKGPVGPGAITVLAGLRQAVYGFQVLASRSTEQERDAYNDALRLLRKASRTVTELAGPAAPAAPLGYGLPSGVSTKDERRTLAQDLLSALPQAVIAGSAARAGDEDAIAGTVHLMSLAVRLGISFRVPAAPFPGLIVPAA